MKIPVDEAPAGAALNIAVAKALGWKPGIHKRWDGSEYECGCWHDETREHPCTNISLSCEKDYDDWSPSSDIMAAWPLVVKLAHRGFCNLTVHHNGMISCYVPSGNILQAANDAPLAICRAFLKAHGVEFVEVPDDA